MCKAYVSCCHVESKHLSLFSLAEVKIKPEHMQGASDVTVEPVTAEMADKMGKPPKVEVTKSQKDL